MLEIISLVGPLSIAIALALLGLLSRRLGRVTHAAPYYLSFFAAAISILVAVVLRLFAYFDVLPHNIPWSLVYNGLLAGGVTLGVIVAWRYWSWLLAERD